MNSFNFYDTDILGYVHFIIFICNVGALLWHVKQIVLKMQILMSPYLLFINIFIYICIANVGLLWMKFDTEGWRQDGAFPIGVIMILITELCFYVATNLDMQANKRHGCNVPWMTLHRSKVSHSHISHFAVGERLMDRRLFRLQNQPDCSN